MKKLLTFLFSFGAAMALAQAPAIQWQKSLGGTGSEIVRSIQQTTDGGYIAAGYTNSNNGDVTGTHGSGITADFWVVKLNGTGTIQWQKTLGGSADDLANTVQQTTDGGYIVAGLSGSTDGDVTGNQGNIDYWVVKLSSTGAIQWQKSLGGTEVDFATSIQQTTDSGYIVAGGSYSNNGDVTGNHGSNDYWVVKLNSTGAVQWQKALGGTDVDYVNSIRQTTDGGYIAAGYSYSNNGDVTGNHDSGLTADCWVVKLNSTGTIQWQKSLGGTGKDIATAIQQTTDSGYIVAGGASSTDGDVTGNHGSSDYWVVKLSSTGAIQWQKALGGTSNDIATAIQQIPDGGYIVAGGASSNDGDVGGNHSSSIYSDYWVVKLNSTGTIHWQKALGGGGFENAYAIRQTTDDGYIVAGTSAFNDGDVTGNHGQEDFWIVKLGDPNAISAVSQAESFSLYPNPATNEMYLQSSTPIRSVVLTDVSGREVSRILGNAALKMTIPTVALANGVYFLHLETTGGMTTQRFVVARP